jgi:hypothetical protein
LLEDCFLWVDEDDEPGEDELLCDQHTADNAPTRTSAATLPLPEKTVLTEKLAAPDFNVSRKGSELLRL